MERQRQKTARRQEAAARRAAAPRHSGDEDPDIAHIRPGPQPHPWADLFPDEPGESDEPEQ